MVQNVGIQDNEVNITLQQGKTQIINLTVRDSSAALIDLTGYDVRMKAKTRYGTSTTVFDFNLSEGHFTIPTPTSGVVKLTLLPSDTSNINFRGDQSTQELVYDIELISTTGTISSPAWGVFTIKREVTN